MLKLALSEKGISAGTHYDLHPVTTTSIAAQTSAEVAQEQDDDEGIHL